MPLIYLPELNRTKKESFEKEINIKFIPFVKLQTILKGF
jgi:hypothetical protein